VAHALQIPFHPRDMQLIRNVSYGPLPRHRLDVWRMSTTPTDAPVIFYIHGGAWTFGDNASRAVHAARVRAPRLGGGHL